MKSTRRPLTLLSILLVVLVLLNALPFIQRERAAIMKSQHTVAPGIRSSSPPSPIPTIVVLPNTIMVSSKPWGTSTCYIGASEGSSRFSIADLQDLGVNTYHIYAGMSRWETHDDSSTYGYPTIQQIKANPDVINWKLWDSIMTSPPGGSDYLWEPPPRWHGNARTLLSELQAAHIRIVLTLRNRDDQHQPSWSPDPPRTTADWNEWWEHVFATVYWLDVRNHYDVTDFEIHNEPNIPGQGWIPEASETEYETFARYTYDVISYVFHAYLPGRSFHVYAPATSNSTWPRDMLHTIPHYFDSMDIHVYGDFRAEVQQMHGWMNQAGYGNEPLWVSEWGSYKHQYNSEPFGVSLLNNMIYASFPGNNYVYGSDIFALYDFATNADGLIDYKGSRRIDYYAVRMGIRALQGCRTTYQSVIGNRHLLAITTADGNKHIYLLVTNQDSSASYTIDANLSALLHQASGTMWQFDTTHQDVIVRRPAVVNGNVTLTIPASSALLLKFSAS